MACHRGLLAFLVAAARTIPLEFSLHRPSLPPHRPGAPPLAGADPPFRSFGSRTERDQDGHLHVNSGTSYEKQPQPWLHFFLRQTSFLNFLALLLVLAMIVAVVVNLISKIFGTTTTSTGNNSSSCSSSVPRLVHCSNCEMGLHPSCDKETFKLYSQGLGQRVHQRCC
eukprot:GHVT01014393.1.p1 GENE.GHVT01014393.1~~GHVT01014393.1.p1  ORF type:complete len:168 (+),score=23.76 GHVT01014393.1:905-1408(+)